MCLNSKIVFDHFHLDSPHTAASTNHLINTQIPTSAKPQTSKQTSILTYFAPANVKSKQAQTKSITSKNSNINPNVSSTSTQSSTSYSSTDTNIDKKHNKYGTKSIHKRRRKKRFTFSDSEDDEPNQSIASKTNRRKRKFHELESPFDVQANTNNKPPPKKRRINRCSRI